MGNYSATVSVTQALVDRWTAALASQPDVAVTWGPRVGQMEAKTFLAIGTDDPDENAGIVGSSEIDWAGLGARSRDETVTVWSTLTHWSGSTDADATMLAADAILKTLQDDLFANPIVDGALYALIGSTTWALSQGAKGAAARCVFAVRARVRLSL